MDKAGMLSIPAAEPILAADAPHANEDNTMISPVGAKQTPNTSSKTRRTRKKASATALELTPVIPALSPVSSPIIADSESEEDPSPSLRKAAKRTQRTKTVKPPAAARTRTPEATDKTKATALAIVQASESPREGVVDAGVQKPTPQKAQRRTNRVSELPLRHSARVAPLPDLGRVFEPCHPETLPGPPALHGKLLLEDRKYALYNGIMLPAVYCASDMRRYVNGELANMDSSLPRRRSRRQRNRHVQWQEELEW